MAMSRVGAKATVPAPGTRTCATLHWILVYSYQNLRLLPPKHPCNRAPVPQGPIPEPPYKLVLCVHHHYYVITEGKALYHIHLSQDSLENTRMVTKKTRCHSQGCLAHYLPCLTRHISLSIIHRVNPLLLVKLRCLCSMS